MSAQSPDPCDQMVAVRYSLTAEPSPGLLSRVVQPFARRDLIPDHMSAHRTRRAMHIEIVMASMPASMVHLVEGNLAQIVGVTRIEAARLACAA